MTAPARPTPPCANCVSEHGRADAACPYCGGSGVCPSARLTPPATLVERLRERIAAIDKVVSECDADLAEAKQITPNEPIDSCELCMERLADKAVMVDALAALQSPPPADGSQP